MKHILATCLMALFLGVGAAACGTAETEDLGEEGAVAEAEGALTSPYTFPDCAAPATDCCHPVCKAYVSACCVKNACGMPVESTIKGSGPWAGLSLKCSDLTGYQVAVEEAPAD